MGFDYGWEGGSYGGREVNGDRLFMEKGRIVSIRFDTGAAPLAEDGVGLLPHRFLFTKLSSVLANTEDTCV